MNLPEWLAPYLFATLVAGLLAQVIAVFLLLILLYRGITRGARALVRRRRSASPLTSVDHHVDRSEDPAFLAD